MARLIERASKTVTDTNTNQLDDTHKNTQSASSNFKWHCGHALSESDWKAARQRGGCWLPGISCTEANFNLNANVITIQTDWTSTSVSASVDSLPPLCNTSECLNAYNGLTNEYLCSCLFTENQFVLSRKSREPWNVLRRTARGLHDGWILKKSACVCVISPDTPEAWQVGRWWWGASWPTLWRRLLQSSRNAHRPGWRRTGTESEKIHSIYNKIPVTTLVYRHSTAHL